MIKTDDSYKQNYQNLSNNLILVTICDKLKKKNNSSEKNFEKTIRPNFKGQLTHLV